MVGLCGCVTTPEAKYAPFEDVSGSNSGPVERMKSAKSAVVSIFALGSRAMIGLERPIDVVDDVCNWPFSVCDEGGRLDDEPGRLAMARELD